MDVNRYLGVLFGQAVGDARGLGTEFMSRREVLDAYPDGLTRYDQIIRDAHRKRWRHGDWTDDTEQMTLIIDSLLEKSDVNLCDIGRRILNWANQGGIGLGITVNAVLHHPDFPIDPHKAAKDIWERTDRWVAANGAVMRTSVLGLWDYHDGEKVRQNTESVCRITHFDPRCVASCVVVTFLIRHLVQGDTNIDSLLSRAREIACKYDERVAPYFDAGRGCALEDLELDCEDDMGYTLKTLSAAIWALNHAESFESGILAIIHQGGDADTNASVAGALLGARFGYDSIPSHWVEDLSWRQYLNRIANQLLQMIDGRAPKVSQ